MTQRRGWKSRRTLAGGVGYRICRRVYRAAVRAVDPRAATIRALQRSGDVLTIGDATFDLAAMRNIYVIGFGKAAAAMAQGVEAVLGDRITAGVVVTKYGHALPTAQDRGPRGGASHARRGGRRCDRRDARFASRTSRRTIS